MSGLDLAQLAACLEPISPQAAAGQDARLESNHELVRAEIAKLTALEAAVPKWEQVESLGLTLLKTQSKDLLIAAYVAYALCERYGAEGAERGLGLVADLLAKFGGALYPQRARARVNALEWLLDRFQGRLPQLATPSREQVRAFEQRTSQLRDAALVLCGDDAPSFAELFRTLERMALSAPAAAPAVASPASPPIPPSFDRAGPASGVRPAGGQPPRAPSPAGAPAQGSAALPLPVVAAQPNKLTSPPASPARAADAGVLGSPLAASGTGAPGTTRSAAQPPPVPGTSYSGSSSSAATAAAPSVAGPTANGAAAANGAATRALGSGAASPLANAAVRAAQPAPGGGEVEEVVHAFGVPPAEPAKVQGYAYRAGLVLIDLARTRFQADRSDPRAYRWLRTGMWLGWERPPAANRRGRTEIDPPSAKRRAELAQLVQGEQWDEVLAHSEAVAVDCPFWLDLHWITRRALERLGERFAAAEVAVERELAALMARMPALPELQFADGTPFASPEAAAWLKASGTGAPHGEAAASCMSELCASTAKGERAALETFEKELRECGSKRAAFQLRLELARALGAAGKSEQALHLCLGLEQELDAYRLELWEPELAAAALKTLWQMLSATRANGRSHAEATRVGARLAQLAPTSLL